MVKTEDTQVREMELPNINPTLILLVICKRIFKWSNWQQVCFWEYCPKLSTVSIDKVDHEQSRNRLAQLLTM